LESQFQKELENSGKPEEIVRTIVQWKLQKHFSDLVLLSQMSIKDESKRVQDLIDGILSLEEYKRFSI
jgi:translation elongation factor EF-Ts